MMNIITKFLKPSNGRYHDDYLRFAGWSLVSNIFVSIQSVLSTHNMLSVLTLDDSAQSLTTLNYVGKDIIGQLGSLIYITRMGNKIDAKPIKFLHSSNILQQSSFILVAITPLCDPSLFLPLTGLSNICLNISFTGYGTLNALCIRKSSTAENMGEIYSKLTVLNTLSSSIGLLIGVFFNLYVDSTAINSAVIPLCGIIRVLTVNKSIQCIIKK
jgi:hypothetical protein